MTSATTIAGAAETDAGPDAGTEAAAREVLARLEDAWNRGDGAAFGAPYDDTASFVTVQGHLHHGPAIGAGHAGILATIYAGSTNRMELVEARRVADDVIVLTSRHTLDVPQGPLAGVREATSTSVLVRRDASWVMVATQNTLVAA